MTASERKTAPQAADGMLDPALLDSISARLTDLERCIENKSDEVRAAWLAYGRELERLSAFLDILKQRYGLRLSADAMNRAEAEEARLEDIVKIVSEN